MVVGHGSKEFAQLLFPFFRHTLSVVTAALRERLRSVRRNAPLRRTSGICRSLLRNRDRSGSQCRLLLCECREQSAEIFLSLLFPYRWWRRRCSPNRCGRTHGCVPLLVGVRILTKRLRRWPIAIHGWSWCRWYWVPRCHGTPGYADRRPWHVRSSIRRSRCSLLVRGSFRLVRCVRLGLCTFPPDVTRHTPFWRSPFAKPFIAPPLPILGEVHRFLARAKAGVNPFWAEEQLATLLPQLLEHASDSAPRTRRPPTAGMRRLARDTDALLGSDFSRVETLTMLAKRLGVSASYLARAYRAATGRTLHGRIAQLRLAEALRRLAAGATDLTALALELGYSSHSHFTAEFRRHLGVPPSRFRLNTQI